MHSSNPFHFIPSRTKSSVSVYADYKHFQEIFSKRDELPTLDSWVDSLKDESSNTEIDPHNATLWVISEYYMNFTCSFINSFIIEN